MINIEYYIIKNTNGLYLVEHKHHDGVYLFTNHFQDAFSFGTRGKAVTFMKNNNIKGIVYKVFYKELESLE